MEDFEAVFNKDVPEDNINPFESGYGSKEVGEEHSRLHLLLSARFTVTFTAKNSISVSMFRRLSFSIDLCPLSKHRLELLKNLPFETSDQVT